MSAKLRARLIASLYERQNWRALVELSYGRPSLASEVHPSACIRHFGVIAMGWFCVKLITNVMFEAGRIASASARLSFSRTREDGIAIDH